MRDFRALTVRLDFSDSHCVWLFELALVLVRFDQVANRDSRHRFLVSVVMSRLVLAADWSPAAMALRGEVCSSTSVEAILEGSPR
jgi:hypothetical protein